MSKTARTVFKQPHLEVEVKLYLAAAHLGEVFHPFTANWKPPHKTLEESRIKKISFLFVSSVVNYGFIIMIRVMI